MINKLKLKLNMIRSKDKIKSMFDSLSAKKSCQDIIKNR
jgi:hypothetical protein